MQKFQKILFLVAVGALGFSIYYYLNLEKLPQKPSVISTIEDGKAASVDRVREFNVQDYGIEGEEVARLNAYLSDVKGEVNGIIARNETVVVLLSEFKTGDDYKRKLYMALSMASRLKVISPVACDSLKKKLLETSDVKEQARLKQSQEYIVCFPGKW